MKGKTSFIGLNSRQVLSQVGCLGEEIAAALVKGEIVSGYSDNAISFADIVNRRAGLALQVKMCNGRHAQRPLPKQVVDLYDEVKQPSFLFDKGAYAFIFYRGISDRKCKNVRTSKSKIYSRKFSRGMRRTIIAKELQYIYIIDVSLLRYMADRPEFIKTGAIVYIPEEKPTRGKVLYLNRTLMKGFPEGRKTHRELLDTALGNGHWSIRTAHPLFRFTQGTEGSFQQRIPVHIVGSRPMVRSVLSIINKAIPEISLEHAKEFNLS